MTISPGALVLCRQTGKQLFVAVRETNEGRWYLQGKITDQDGRGAITGRSDVGVGDITIVKAQPAHTRGEMIEHASQKLMVLRDLGDSIECSVPAHTAQLLGGDRLFHDLGHTTSVSKADLMIGAMGIGEIVKTEKENAYGK
jgi:hypothetical protein